MMTSSNGNIFRVSAPLWGESTGHQWIPFTEASDAELRCFDLHLDERLSKQSWGWWFETLSRSLWRHCYEYSIITGSWMKQRYANTRLELVLCLLMAWPHQESGYRQAYHWLGMSISHDYVIKWKHSSSALLALCAGNSPVPVNSLHKGQWRGALMFSLIYAWINDWVNNREAGDLRRHRSHCDVNVMHR